MTHELEKAAWDRLNALLDEAGVTYRAGRDVQHLVLRINLVARALTLLRREQYPATSITLWIVGQGMGRAYWTGEWHHDTAGSQTKATRNRNPYRLPVYRAPNGQTFSDAGQLDWLSEQAGGGV